jgi:hypothetical protein
MTILTSYTAATYKAQIRSSAEQGFKQLFTATCTMGERQAAQAAVRPVLDKAEIAAATGTFFQDPKRKQVFNVWTFTPKPKLS